MKKTALLILAITMVLCIKTNGQTTSNGATQAAHLALNNGIEIAYVSTSGTIGNEAIMEFISTSDFQNGVPSPEQELRVRSNRNFTVEVRCDEHSFVYQGSNNVKMEDVPTDALQLLVTQNNTGGTIQAPFSNNSYAIVKPTNQKLLVDGHYGGDQRFDVKYRYKPGYTLPAGVYKVDVVYTATQQ